MNLSTRPSDSARVAIVVGDQHASAPHARWHWPAPCSGSAHGRVGRRQHLVRQVHDELAAAAQSLAANLDAPAVQRHQPLDQRQADAEAAFGAIDGRIHLREHREQARHHFCGETDAVVADGNHQLGILQARIELDASFGIRVLRGIGEQVADDLREPQRIRLQPHVVAG